MFYRAGTQVMHVECLTKDLGSLAPGGLVVKSYFGPFTFVSFLKVPDSLSRYKEPVA